MIVIEKPEVVLLEDKARLQTEIDIDGAKKIIWFEVDVKYKDYLCYERADAFVIALLNYAMREGHDIKCKAPMGEDLYYQITTYLIDAVYKGSKVLYHTKIISDVDCTLLPSANAVGTGISAGIDSFHTIATHSNSKFINHNITHLAYNNVGSHGAGDRAKKLYLGRLNAARRFAEEYNYELVETNSNIHDQISQIHFLTHTYTGCFAIYCLQKLYSVYYYSSSRSFLEFSLKDNEKNGAGAYDLLTLSMCSTRTLRIISEGATLSRLEKTMEVVNYEPSFKYLNVCTQTIDNCSRCEKCTRTMLALDAIGQLDKYDSVFDLQYYRNHQQKYFETLLVGKLLKKNDYVELYPYYKNQIKLLTKIKGFFKFPMYFFWYYIPTPLKNRLRKIKNKYI